MKKAQHTHEDEKDKSGAHELDEVEARVLKELATAYDYVPGRMKEVTSFVKALNSFARGLGDKYYSEVLGKRTHLLVLDIEAASLRSEHLRLRAERFYSVLEKGFLRKEAASLDRKAFDQFKKELSDFERELEAIYEKALGITKDIKSDFERKGVF